MEEFSLYVLDITMNSVRAGADKIGITLDESADGMLTFSVTDNGCGMSEEAVRRLSDPFFTTRKTRDVGLGVPLLKMLSEMTSGTTEISSRPVDKYPVDHGTELRATFGMDHIDMIPLGDMIGTVITLIQGSPDVDFTYIHRRSGGEVRLSCEELRAVLGDVSLGEFEVLEWIKEYLTEAYGELH